MNNPSLTFIAVAQRAIPTGVRTLFAGLLLAGSLVLAGEPIDGVDVKLGKNPGGSITIVATSDARGQFSLVVKEPGQYLLSTSRHGGNAGQPYQLSLKATGTTLKKSGPGTFEFTVGREPVTLRGQVTDNNSPKPQDR